MRTAKSSRAQGTITDFFMDTSAALYRYCKGASENQAIEHCIRVFHFALYRLNCQVWFAFVPSAQNWTDGISRDGLQDRSTIEQGFAASAFDPDDQLWRMTVMRQLYYARKLVDV